MQTLKQTIATRQQTLQQHWQQLPVKDRRALTLLSIFGGLLLAIYGVFLPCFDHYQNSKQGFQEQTELLHWLTAQEANITGLAASPNTNTGSALSQINLAAKQHSLTIQRIQPQADDSIKVWLENAAFDNSVNWLETLGSSGVSLRDLSINKASSGVINFRGTFYKQKGG